MMNREKIEDIIIEGLKEHDAKDRARASKFYEHDLFERAADITDTILDMAPCEHGR